MIVAPAIGPTIAAALPLSIPFPNTLDTLHDAVGIGIDAATVVVVVETLLRPWYMPHVAIFELLLLLPFLLLLMLRLRQPEISIVGIFTLGLIPDGLQAAFGKRIRRRRQQIVLPRIQGISLHVRVCGETYLIGMRPEFK